MIRRLTSSYEMDCVLNLLVSALLLSISAGGAQADALVFGSVFCDRCKDGALSLFDYPMNGVKVAMMCVDGYGQGMVAGEATTNWFGSYAMLIGDNRDLSNCYAQVSTSDQSLDPCGTVAGPAQRLARMFSIFGGEMYRVDTLLAQPADSMPFCPTNGTSSFNPAAPTGESQASLSPPPAAGGVVGASACTFRDWAAPEHWCYWKVVSPETTVASAFGAVAASRYGSDMTLREGLRGRGDAYKTLLREGTTALLNSYNGVGFAYSSVTVTAEMNWALTTSEKNVLHTALRFMRSNGGDGSRSSCNFIACHR